MSDRFIATLLCKHKWAIFDKKTASTYYGFDGEDGIFLHISPEWILYGKLPGEICFDPEDMDSFEKWFDKNMKYTKKAQNSE